MTQVVSCSPDFAKCLFKLASITAETCEANNARTGKPFSQGTTGGQSDATAHLPNPLPDPLTLDQPST